MSRKQWGNGYHNGYYEGHNEGYGDGLGDAAKLLLAPIAIVGVGIGLGVKTIYDKVKGEPKDSLCTCSWCGQQFTVTERKSFYNCPYCHKVVSR